MRNVNSRVNLPGETVFASTFRESFNILAKLGKMPLLQGICDIPEDLANGYY